MSDLLRQQPRGRDEGVIVYRLESEVLVYDVARNKAHCLNASMGRVWDACDGRTDVSEIASRQCFDLAAAPAREAVWQALRDLERRHLLVGRLSYPNADRRLTRREWARRAGLAAAAALPVVVSLAAPPVSVALTCLNSGAACTTSAQCCSGLCSAGTCA